MPAPGLANRVHSDSPEIFTIGHSNHPPEKFLELLALSGVRLLIDVRRFPGSRRVPWTGLPQLESLLETVSVDYLHLVALGGRRRPSGASVNSAWRLAQFEGYADHLATPEFEADFTRLEDAAKRTPAAVMCAEAQWWRCHRRLLADLLLVRGWRVSHIDSRGSQSSHALSDHAVVEDGRLLYPGPPPEQERA